jgi:uncharacterized cupin superfamily protein
MSELIVVRPGGGEVIGDSPERRVEILCDDDALHVTWSRFCPGREGAPLHVHRHHTDIFYVLEGELTVKLGAASVVVSAGTFARVPPLVVHGFANESDADMRYLNFHAPGMRFADYLRSLRDGHAFVYDQEPPPADGGRPAAEAVVGEPRIEIDAVAIAKAWCEPGDQIGGRWLYVLEGELVLAAGGRELLAQAGTWMEVPRGASSVGAGRVRLLSVNA